MRLEEEKEKKVAAEIVLRTQDGVELPVEQAGEGEAIVLLHGLTATRRYVVMGSKLLQRSGHRVIAYDARGHGSSSPAPARDAYGYPQLACDLEAVLDALGVEQALLAGASMGAHTIARFALQHPGRVRALALITPAFDPDLDMQSEDAFAGWDALARGLREKGIEGFLAAYDLSSLPDRWRETAETVVRQRLACHLHLDAVADALESVPRSQPFESIGELSSIEAPTLIVASRDEADPGHPLAVAQRYAAAIPRARLLVEEPGAAPVAWQGARLSRALADLVKESSAS